MSAPRTSSHALTAALAVGTTLLGGFLLVATPAAQALPADTPDGSEVCGPLDSGKIDTVGDPLEITITADPGFLIDGYCVKAGSSLQGDGPVYVAVDPPQASVTFSYPTGKAISHYSYSQVPIEESSGTTGTTETTETTGTTATTETTETTATTETTETTGTTGTTETSGTEITETTETTETTDTEETSVLPSEATETTETEQATSDTTVAGEQAVPGAVDAGQGGDGSGDARAAGLLGLLVAGVGAGVIGAAAARRRRA